MCQEKNLRMAIFNKLDDLKFKNTSPIIYEIIGESSFNVGSNFLKFLLLLVMQTSQKLFRVWKRSFLNPQFTYIIFIY